MSETDLAISAQLRALELGRATLDRSWWTLVLARGGDAGPWLGDLISGPVGRLEPAATCRSLLLSPTGHLRADLHVARLDDGFLLIQDPRQPRAIDELLAPYVLSADVALSRLGASYVCAPGDSSPIPREGARLLRPSILGGGWDAVSPGGSVGIGDRMVVSEEAVEARRILLGQARFPVDVDEGSTPSEAGLVELAVDRDKGCFLGQESVARIANLGHPVRVIVAVEADDALVPGDAVSGAGRDVGVVTSAWRTVGLARIRWDAREEELHSGDRALRLRSPS